MKTLQQIIEVIKEEIVQESLGQIALESITDDHRLIQDLALDSLGYASVMLAGEKFVEVTVPENQIDWAKIQTVKDLAEVLFKCQMPLT